MYKLLILISFTLCIIGAIAHCNIYLAEPKPDVIRSLGTKPVVITSKLDHIELEDNENVTIICPRGLSYRQYYDMRDLSVASIEASCVENIIRYDFDFNENNGGDITIYCSSPPIVSLYESIKSLPGCDNNTMTLIIGYDHLLLGNMKSVGLCYDQNTQRLKFASYLAYPPNDAMNSANWNNELQRLNLDNYINSIDKYFSFPSESEFNSAIQQSKKYDAHFDATILQYSNLLQDESLVTSLQEYNDLLRIIWLKKLRTGNWKRFLDALKQHSTNDETNCKYDVRVGVSDVATVPRLDHKSYTSPIVIKVSSFNLEMPAYIWAHLRFLGTVKGAAREFVVVGQNSPYANIADMYNFCSDICPEIPFLKDSEFGLLHLMPEFGVVQCCSVKEAASKLIDFPLQGTQLTAMSNKTLPNIFTNNYINN